jgi:septum site-determining protein MinC
VHRHAERRLDADFAFLRGKTRVSTVRGRGRSVEIAVDRALPAAGEELRAHFIERPDFYRGSHAVANLGLLEPGAMEIGAFRDLLAEFGITLDGVSGPERLAETLANLQLAYLGPAPVAEVSALPRSRPARQIELSAEARSLVADFAGARSDLAQRRIAKTAAAPAGVASAGVAIPPTPTYAPAGVSTLYHRGTLRGGQALHNMGNIVVIGDLNPGAELIASGDIVVVGALRGTAHAGAQGDRTARVIALEFAPTQLRIATVIGADALIATGPQQAVIEGDRIAVAPLGATPSRQEISI